MNHTTLWADIFFPSFHIRAYSKINQPQPTPSHRWGSAWSNAHHNTLTYPSSYWVEPALGPWTTLLYSDDKNHATLFKITFQPIHNFLFSIHRIWRCSIGKFHWFWKTTQSESRTSWCFLFPINAMKAFRLHIPYPWMSKEANAATLPWYQSLCKSTSIIENMLAFYMHTLSKQKVLILCSSYDMSICLLPRDSYH